MKFLKTGISNSFFICALTFGSAAQAQFSDLMRNIRDIGDLAKSAVDTVGAIKSITDVTSGFVSAGTKESEADGKVVLYTTATCVHCKRALAHVRANSIAFVEKDIEVNPLYRAEFKRYGGVGVPFILMGRKTVSGFSAESFDAKYIEFQRDNLALKPAQAAVATETASPNAVVGSARSTASLLSGWQPGDTLLGKINGVKIYQQATKTGAEVAVLSKADELVFMGEEQAGLVKVSSGKGDGWVDRLLVRKQ